MSIVVELELDTGEFTTRMLHAGQSVNQFVGTLNSNVVMLRRAENASAGFLRTIRDFAIVFGIAGTAMNAARQVVGGWVGDLIRVNAEFERMTVLMRGMSSASDPIRDAAQNVAYLRDMARNAPFSLGAMSEAFTRLKATGIDPTTGSLQAYVDGIAGMGGTEDTLKRASVAISQMAGKGVIQMEELRQQLGEAIPRATELMARSLGVSYATLVQQISTGTVAAKENLAALELELERVFGGAARAQMETYNGLMARISTQFQDLALVAGNAGFFEALKDQLQQFSQALDGRFARGFAKELGESFASLVRIMGDAVQFVVRFRDEIYTAGVALAGAFSARLAIAGLTSFIGAISTARKEIALLNQQFVMSQRVAALGAAASGATTAVTTLGAAAASTGAAISVMASGIAVLAPYIPLIAGAVMIAGSAFGWFSNSARDAWQELEKFGAVSRERVEEAKQFLAQEENQLRSLEAERERRARTVMGWNSADKQRNRDLFRQQFNEENDIEEKRAALVQKRIQLAGWVSDVEEDEAKRTADNKIRELNREEQKLRAKYDLESRDREKRFQAEVNAATSAGKSSAEIEKRYAADRRQLIVGTYDERMRLYQQELDTQIQIAKTGDETQRRAAEETIVRLTDSMQRLETFKKQAGDMPDGTKIVEKPLDDDALWKRGNQHLERIRAEIAGTKAELSGAQGEAAKLAYQLSQARYGDADTQKVKELTEALVQAAREKEALDDLLDGRNKLEREIMSARVRAEQELIDIQTKGLSGAESILMKMRLGYYQGFGQGSEAANAAKSFAQLLMDGAGNAQKASGAVSGGIFSNDTIARGRTLLGVVNSLSGSLGDFARVAQGTDISKIFSLPKLPSGTKNGSIMFGGQSGTTGLSTAFEDRLSALFRAMPENIKASITSGYRSIAEQDKLWQAALLKYGSVEEARKWVAPPGNSAHNSGNAADLKFNTPDAKDWAHQMAPMFGLKFPLANEPWHIQIDGNVDTSWISQMQDGLSQLEAAEKKLRETKWAKELGEDTKKLNIDLSEAEDRLDGVGKKEAEVRAKIKAGEYGDNRNPISERYKEILAAAKAADQAETERSQNQQRRDAVDRSRTRVDSTVSDLEERAAEARARLSDPLMFERGDGYFRLLRQFQVYEREVLASYGRDSAAFKQLMAEKQAALQNYYNSDAMSRAADLAQETRQIRLSMMNTSQARDFELQEAIRVRQMVLAQFRGSAEERLQVERVVTENITALRAQAALSTPMGSMFQQWADGANNFQQAMANAWETSINGLTQFLTTGKADFGQMLQSIASDVLNMGLKLAASQMFGNKATSATASMSTKLFGVAHTGASNVSQARSVRSVNPMAFLGAQRFHKGGFPGLRPGEVPIIAKEGEEVGWPSQLAKKYGGKGGGNPISIKNEFQINASGGTPEQNEDLANRIGMQVEQRMRAVVVDELITQMRPGNLLGG